MTSFCATRFLNSISELKNSEPPLNRKIHSYVSAFILTMVKRAKKGAVNEIHGKRSKSEKWGWVPL